MKNLKRIMNIAEPSIEEKILGDHRFLDIRSYFSFDFSIFSLPPVAHPPNNDGINKFKIFKKKLKAERTGLAKKLYKAWKPNDVSDKFIQYSKFLMQVPARKFEFSMLLKHLTNFEEYCKLCISEHSVDAQSLITIGLPTLIEPTYFWSASIDADQKKVLIQSFEETISNVTNSLPLRSLPSGAAEFKSYLLLTYVIFTEFCSIGLSSNVFTKHLLYFRQKSITNWLNLSASERLQYAVISLHVFFRFFNPNEPFSTKYGFSHNTFSDLHSLLNDAHDASTKLGLVTTGQVFMYLLERIETEALAYTDLTAGRRALKGLTPGEKASMVELVRRFSSYRIPVTAERVEHFLIQFKTTARIRAAIKLLNHLKFYPLWQLGESIEAILTEQKKKFGKLVVSPLGDRTGSTAIINYLVSHSNLKDIIFADDLSHALSLTQEGDRIYFVDDCALSGTQSIHIMQELMGERELKPHHTKHCDPLSSEEQNAVCKRTLVFTYCLACDIAVERMQTQISTIHNSQINIEILNGIPEPSEAKTFSTASSVPWESAEERDELKKFCAEVGYTLLEKMSTDKNWKDERRIESSLGFSDFQRVLVFPYSVPKTSLPLLWLNGNSNFRWTPLFPVND